MALTGLLNARTGTDRAHRSLISSRIGERSGLLWDRQGAMPEWTQFLQEVAAGKAPTNLHTARPKGAIKGPVGRPFD